LSIEKIAIARAGMAHLKAATLEEVSRSWFRPPPALPRTCTNYSNAGYKYIYFNLEKETFLILSVFLFYCAIAYKGLERSVRLILSRKLRMAAFGVLLTCVYPNFYAFWMFFNYINDRFYQLWYSQVCWIVFVLLGRKCSLFLSSQQLAFSLTELSIAFCLYGMLDKTQELRKPHLWVCAVFSGWHITESLIDQGFQYADTRSVFRTSAGS
jgi:hypothetical protein